MSSLKRAHGNPNTSVPQKLETMTRAQVLAVDEALTSLGDFGEVRIVKTKGRVRFIETLESRDLLKLGDGREVP